MSAPERVPTPLHHRIRLGVRSVDNWLEVVRFLVVGVSGFAANVAAYAAAVHLLHIEFHVAAFVGLCAGVANNFVWHKYWTFESASAGQAKEQSVRFVAVYGATFLVGLVILQVAVDAGTSRVIGQAVSQILITPLNYLGHKLWTFRHDD